MFDFGSSLRKLIKMQLSVASTVKSCSDVVCLENGNFVVAMFSLTVYCNSFQTKVCWNKFRLEKSHMCFS